MKTSIIVAVSENGVIGANGAIPWHLPSDLSHFRQMTTGHHVIMGRKTYEAIGKALPERTNIVITKNPEYKAPGITVVNSLDEALTIARRSGNSECFIIGGGEIFKMALPRAEKIYLTKVHERVCGDTYFPNLDPVIWKQVSCEKHLADSTNPVPYDFCIYERSY